jgi:hypothetical protein
MFYAQNSLFVFAGFYNMGQKWLFIFCGIFGAYPAPGCRRISPATRPAPPENAQDCRPPCAPLEYTTMGILYKYPHKLLSIF